MNVVAAPPPPPAVYVRSYLLAGGSSSIMYERKPRLKREVLQLFCQSDKEAQYNHPTRRRNTFHSHRTGSHASCMRGRYFEKIARHPRLRASLLCNQNSLILEHPPTPFFVWEKWERKRPLNSHQAISCLVDGRGQRVLRGVSRVIRPRAEMM